ncbi:MAG: hypothetical protein K2X27_02550 [Candidatus Obscuribacterales bacterium]|nr:hypothetical protein [Candidatus Obscuribacterales bacterium]
MFDRNRFYLISLQLSFFLLLCLFTLPRAAFCSDWEESPSEHASANTKTGINPGPPAKPSQSKFYLQGQVQHSDQLPALEDDLQAGASFNPQALQNAKYASSWFKIPSWFAGTFESTESRIDFIKDYATGQVGRPRKVVSSLGRELHGFQKDQKGDIWHYYVQSGSSRSEQAGHITINNIDWYGPEYVSDSKVLMRIQATSLVVDKNSGIIVDSFRREDLKTYEPMGKGVIKVEYTSKSFDSRGRPRDLQDGVSIHRLIAAFKPIDRDGENDYKQMFKDFLNR